VIAVDTNVIVRYLTADDPQQFTQARALIESENVYVCTTVLLETEWVLRRAYRLGRAQTIAALTAFAGLPHINLEDAASAAKALDWARRGMDFAFVSFDRRFATVADALSDVKVRPP
jgi:predicted nucleic acid-binding protein